MQYKSGDPEFESWNDRGVNLRFKGSPSLIVAVDNAKALQEALQKAVDTGDHVTIRGGGHCLENFVSDPPNVARHKTLTPHTTFALALAVIGESSEKDQAVKY